MTKKPEDLFDKMWTRMLKKPGFQFRNLNLREQDELKELIKGMFVATLDTKSHVDEAMRAAINEGMRASAPDNGLKKMMKDGFGELQSLIGQLKSAPSAMLERGGGRPSVSQGEVAQLLGDLFKSDMRTNIDEVDVEGRAVGGVQDVVERLKKLKGEDKGHGDNST